MIRRYIRLYQTPGTFSQQTLLEALIVTGGSACRFGEQYRDLLLYLHHKLDENNSNQRGHTAVQQYIQCSELPTKCIWITGKA